MSDLPAYRHNDSPATRAQPFVLQIMRCRDATQEAIDRQDFASAARFAGEETAWHHRLHIEMGPPWLRSRLR
jgi:hypothetical protein